MNKKAAIVLLILVLALIPIPFPTVKADGALSAQQVDVEWQLTANQGYSSTNVTGNSLEDSTWANKFNTTDEWGSIDYDDVQIYWMRARIYSDDNDDRQMRFGAWTYVADNDGGALLGSSTETISELPIGYAWRSSTLSTWVSVGNAECFFYGVWAEDEFDHWLIARGVTGSGPNIFDNTGWSDPFFESASYNELRPIQFRVWGFNTNDTNHNQYYGTADNYVARRDMAYTFPAGASNRRMEITYPVSEYVVNVTYSNGGLWDTVLPSSAYTDQTRNSTFKEVVLTESTINTYGTEYRLFTQTYNYNYNFNGFFFENGTDAGSVTVTAYVDNGTTSDFTVNGETVFSVDESVDVFTWPVGTTIRIIKTMASDGNYTLFTPETNYSVYSFQIKDFTGAVGQGSNYLSSYRFVNGTEYLIERNEIIDIVNPIPFVMAIYRLYNLKAILSDGTTNTFDDFIAGVDPSLILNIREPSFSRKAQLTYRYVTIESTRPTDTSFRVNYQDNLDQTTLVEVTIAYRNGTVAYSDTGTSDSMVFNWLNADNETDYVVLVEVTHEFFGSLNHEEAFTGATDFDAVPDLSVIGTFGPTTGTNILYTVLIFILAGVFSYFSVPLAAFSVTVLTGVFVYYGFVSISTPNLIIAFCFAIMIGLGWRKTG